MMNSEEIYWTNRYQENSTGWDVGYPTTPIKTYIDQLHRKEAKILIPGAGNAYEAEYLFQKGFVNTHVLDISKEPLKALKSRVSDFPTKQLIHQDFFNHEGTYDLIFEQTFFCSFEPTVKNRNRYAEKMSELLTNDGLLVGVWFQHPYISGESKRPFGGSKEEYLNYLTPYFNVKVFEECYNSIPPRSGNELFGIFQKK